MPEFPPPTVPSVGDYPDRIGIDWTRYVVPGWFIHSTTGLQVVAGRIYYIPIFVVQTTTFIRIGIYVSSLLAGSADLRIFAWDNGVPGALILSAGTVDTGSTGFKELTISQELTRGYYFLAVRCTSACSLLGPNTINPVVPPVPGFETFGSVSASMVILSVLAAYADPAPTPSSSHPVNYAFVSLREN